RRTAGVPGVQPHTVTRRDDALLDPHRRIRHVPVGKEDQAIERQQGAPEENDEPNDRSARTTDARGRGLRSPREGAGPSPRLTRVRNDPDRGAPARGAEPSTPRRHNLRSTRSAPRSTAPSAPAT